MRFILYYPRNRLHSLNVLAGALETEPRLGDMDIRFCRGEETFHAEMESSAKENIPSVIGCSLFSVEFAKYSRLITGCKQKYPDHPLPSGRQRLSVSERFGMDGGKSVSSFRQARPGEPGPLPLLLHPIPEAKPYRDYPGLYLCL